MVAMTPALRSRPADRSTRRWRCAASALLVLAPGACTSVIDVHPMATGRVDVSAYELRGPELGLLRREASRLCPQGGDIVRQAGRDQRPTNTDSRMVGLNALGDVLSPPKRMAEMVIVCKEAPEDSVLPAVAGAAAADTAVALPLGPITAEW